MLLSILFARLLIIVDYLRRYDADISIHSDSDYSFSPSPEIIPDIASMKVSDSLTPQVHRHLRRHTMVDPSVVMYGNRETLELNRINRVRLFWDSRII